MNLSNKDIQNLSEIQLHLDSHGINYNKTEYGFCLNLDNGSTYQIAYIPTTEYRIAYPKWKVEGVTKDFLYKQSREAEASNSFRFFIKQFEWEDQFKREILKSYLLHATGKTPNRFFARDTEVKIFSNREIADFQREHCFYGYRSASLNLGLVLKKEKLGLPKGTLLMIMTFGKNFFGKKDDLLEIIRVGTLRKSQVIGGTSKLFNHFINNHPYVTINKKDIYYSKVIYYVDYDHGAGKSADALGFKFVRYSGGGFMNFDVEQNKVAHRQPAKHGEIMQKVAEGKIIGVPNSGVKVYEYLVKPPND